MYQTNKIKISVVTRWALGGQNSRKVDTLKKIAQKRPNKKKYCTFVKKISYVQEVSNI